MPLEPAITAAEAKDIIGVAGIRFLVVYEGSTLTHSLDVSLENGVIIRGTALWSTEFAIRPHQSLP